MKDEEFGGCALVFAVLLSLLIGCVSIERPLVLWCVDDDDRVVPLAPDLVRRGRVVEREWGWLPYP